MLPTAAAMLGAVYAVVAKLVSTWLLLVAAVAGLGRLLTHVLQGSVGARDDDVSRWFAGQRRGFLDGPADVGTLLGETVVGLAVAVLAAVVLSLWLRSWRPAVFFALVTAGIGGLYAVVTRVDPRSRPPVEILDPGLVPTHSFPSGHVATSTAVYGGIVLVLWTTARAVRPWVLVVLVLPALVLLARLYQGAHHLTDVATSVAYAVVWVLVVARLVLAPGARDVRRSRP